MNHKHKYKILYDTQSDDATYVPIRIIIILENVSENGLESQEHTFFTENDEETFQDVKQALVTYLGFPYNFTPI